MPVSVRRGETLRIIDCAAAIGIIDPVIRSTGRRGAPTLHSWWSMAPFETIYIDEMVAICDGGEGPLGHPRVYLNLGSGKIECPYCSRLFINRAMSGGTAAGEDPVPPTTSDERHR